MKKIDENYEFAVFLKAHADDEELDKQFKSLHDKYFKNYNWERCRKCCKKLHATFKENEIDKASKQLKIEKEDFIKIYLKSKDNNTYSTKRTPCPFLKKAIPK